MGWNSTCVYSRYAWRVDRAGRTPVRNARTRIVDGANDGRRRRIQSEIDATESPSEGRIRSSLDWSTVLS